MCTIMVPSVSSLQQWNANPQCCSYGPSMHANVLDPSSMCLYLNPEPPLMQTSSGLRTKKCDYACVWFHSRSWFHRCFLALIYQTMEPPLYQVPLELWLFWTHGCSAYIHSLNFSSVYTPWETVPTSHWDLPYPRFWKYCSSLLDSSPHTTDILRTFIFSITYHHCSRSICLLGTGTMVILDSGAVISPQKPAFETLDP